MPPKIRLLIVAVLGVVTFTMFYGAAAHATGLDTVIELNELITSDLDAIAEGAGDEDLDAVHTGCVNLAMDAELGLTYKRPAAINKAAWREVRSAWKLQVRSGDLCEEAIDLLDPEMLEEAFEILDDATTHVETATTLL